jgi:deoxyribodipyrimidine photolyase-related protein
MSPFLDVLARHRHDEQGRRWVYVACDQLSDAIGPLATHAPRDIGIVLVESEESLRRRPYHQQRLAFLIANQRHFAIEQAQRGVSVRYVQTPGSHREALGAMARQLGPLTMMRAAERELRVDVAPLVESGAIAEIPHEGWLTTAEDFHGSRHLRSTETGAASAPWRMDTFYRRVRSRLRILMEGEAPAGGRWSFDEDNREPWKGAPAAPVPPSFRHDAITDEAVGLVRARFGAHPGCVTPEALPATAAHAEALWRWALAACLPSFGRYEDAMSRRSSGLFHTRVSALINVHRLLPARVVRDVERMDAPLNSREGFIRQVIGWREYVRHVHEATDGFTRLPGTSVERAPTPGDGGHARWRERVSRGSAATAAQPETSWASRGPVGPDRSQPGQFGGSTINLLGAATPLPLAYWGAASGLACLDHVVAGVWRDAWSHHITRLMVLANIASLLDVDPRELTDWFWVAYVDAFDWVVEPNVLGMGVHAAGQVMTTKPYVSGAAYVHRMSDYCDSCAFDPRSTCPLTPLYWAYLARHEEAFSRNQRMGVVMSALRRRAPARRREDARVFEAVRERLTRGERIDQPQEAGRPCPSGLFDDPAV